MGFSRFLESLSKLLYRKLYNRHKYLAFVDTKLARSILYPIFAFFNLFYIHSLRNHFLKQIEKLPKDIQIFFAGRRDFGTHLYLLHYLRLWSQERGRVAALLFTLEPETFTKLVKILLNEIEVIQPNRPIDHLMNCLFGHHTILWHTLLPTYSWLAVVKPDIIQLFDLTELPRSTYNQYVDPFLRQVEEERFSAHFLSAYLKLRKQCDYQWSFFTDLCQLSNHTVYPPVYHAFRSIDISLEQPFVLLNINTKKYINAASRRTIYYPERYNCVIDYLIERGYQVILQGRKEQPIFDSRAGFFDYSHSTYCSIENDLALFAQAEFAICSKSGIETFATICNTPILGLNYTEIIGLQPAKKFRFYPKSVQELESKRLLSWEEYLFSPLFFEIGNHTFEPIVTYLDLNEEEMLAAIDEFLPLLALEEDAWTKYTPEQEHFKSLLSPLHMELYLSPGAPFNSYLIAHSQENRINASRKEKSALQC